MSTNRRRSKRKVKIPAKLGDHVLEPVNHRRTEIGKMVCDDENSVSNGCSKEEVVVTSDAVGNDGIHGVEGNAVFGKVNKGVFGNEDSGSMDNHGECAEETGMDGRDEEQLKNVCDMNNEGKMTSGSQLGNDTAMNTVKSPTYVKTPNSSSFRATLNDNSVKQSYAHAVTKLEQLIDNKPNSVPTEIDENGNEFVIFDDELIKDGSRKWQLTLCGYFMGHNMSVYEFSSIMKEALTLLLIMGPWMAWTSKGISALAIRIGKPLIMDAITANMCKFGMGRIGYARVLVEVRVSEYEEGNGMDMQNLSGRKKVNMFISRKKQPSFEETKDWTQAMILYFKQQWEFIIDKRGINANEEEEDVFEINEGIAKDMNMGHSC
ncbi:hypothetical protein Tco_1412702 [Tanacetum coccineum]